MTVGRLEPFNAIQYTTSYGEKCVATKKDGIVTIQGDKNGVRQIPLDVFMQDFVKDQQKVNLEKSPKKDSVSFSGKLGAYYPKTLEERKKKGMLFGIPAAILCGATSYIAKNPSVIRSRNPKLWLALAVVSGVASFLGLNDAVVARKKLNDFNNRTVRPY